ncbi:nuclear transport factor 2 family protein [Flagellimonas allohymeniacidonis]|uniref:Steroid delta-isomerase n=1 Tax=Flagellimonas allohymeniacidonis TaxID=2517819 RepID=A0A4V6MMB5_9FLAO|nr:nuclear transport factor 2 family protein [Allomuricauda hymeniacidonis]TAI49200.1 steroid delta-isomerase [Allomuricauda hymeniacidonis]
MINKLTLIVFLGMAIILNSQTNTEVYLFDLDWKNGEISLSNPKNISNNDGYDNQPSFWDDDTVLFSSTRAGQTDVKQFYITKGSTSKWITNTAAGSEYSPLRIPGSNNVSAIRLDLDGLQRLYEYDIKTGESELLSDLKIGYHVWYNDHILVSTVLIDNRMDLVVSDLSDGNQFTADRNVGRSLHKIPGTDLISYIHKSQREKVAWTIKSLNVTSQKLDTILTLPSRVEDVAWLSDGTILLPDNNRIARYNPAKDSTWQDFHVFNRDQVFKISRMAVNPSGTRFALVTDVSPTEIVQKQVDTFNKRDLDGFLSCYSDRVLARRFPNDTMYIGKDKMMASYERFFANTKSTRVEVVKRISIGDKIIDEEETLVDGREGHQVALYTIKNGLIQSMSFIFPNQGIGDAESIVKEQLVAYNARDIDAFMDTYSEDIKLYNFPNTLVSEGKEKMRESYGSFFDNTPDLNCEIKNRMVVGNKVIDEEYVTINGTPVSAVAIYEVENGKIAKVTFLQ